MFFRSDHEPLWEWVIVAMIRVFFFGKNDITCWQPVWNEYVYRAVYFIKFYFALKTKWLIFSRKWFVIFVDIKPCTFRSRRNNNMGRWIFHNISWNLSGVQDCIGFYGVNEHFSVYVVLVFHKGNNDVR